MSESEKKVAESLLKIKAIKLQPSEPFTWASGWKSPIYCDNRKTLSFPEIRTLVRDEFVKTVKAKYPQAEVIAGVATGAIAQGALVAQELGLPFIYVRSSPKDHGLGNLIEGDLKAGQKVVVIEDLISTGGNFARGRRRGSWHGGYIHLWLPSERERIQGAQGGTDNTEQLQRYDRDSRGYRICEGGAGGDAQGVEKEPGHLGQVINQTQRQTKLWQNT